MACLDTTSKSLTIELTGSPATQAQWTVHYATRSGTDFTESSNDGVTNSTTPVTMIAAPSGGETISIRDITVYNADVSSATIIIKLVNGGNSRVLYRQTLDTLESWSSLAQKGKDGTQGLTGSVSAASGLILDESSAPNTATNQGALYVPSSDNLLRYRGESNGTERRIALIDTTNLATNDLFYYGSDGLFKRIAIGTLDQVLVAKPSSNPPYQWATPTGREILTANRTYYVRTDGNDSNNGLTNTAGGAFLTPQKAINVTSGLDGGGLYSVKIKFGDGTYNLSSTLICLPCIGVTDVTLEGNTSNKNAVILNATTTVVQNSQSRTLYKLAWLKISNGSTLFGDFKWGCYAYNGGAFNVSSCSFGSCSSHLYSDFNGYIEVAGNTEISENFGSHITAVRQGALAYSTSVTISGTPTMNTEFCNASRRGLVSAWGSTFSGSCTGKRYSADNQGFIEGTSGTSTFFPGTVNGTAVNGIYV